MNSRKLDRTHGTTQELEFLDALGSYSEVEIPLEVLYRNYIRAIGLRKNWMNLDRSVILSRAQSLYLRAVQFRKSANGLV